MTNARVTDISSVLSVRAKDMIIVPTVEVLEGWRVEPAHCVMEKIAEQYALGAKAHRGESFVLCVWVHLKCAA